VQEAAKNDYCEKCAHTGWILDRKTNVAKRCSCAKENIYSIRMIRADIPRRYSNCTLDNYDVMENKSFAAALKASRDFVKRYPKVKKGILFMGPSGVGKTHLAVAMIKSLIQDKGIDCLFMDFQELLRNLQKSYQPDSELSELKVFEPVLNTELLLLDDLGSKAATEWMRDTLAYIVNYRYNNQKISLFTTNFLDEDIARTDYILSDRIGIRIRSRLYEMCERIYLDGDDFRKVFR
jgi:DNA replication protein DnaC